MNNDPELDGKYLGTITKDFVKVCDTLRQASEQLRSRGISDFPVFPICKTGQPLGQLLINKADHDGLDWNYFFSFMEEFSQRKLIEKEELFQDNYKDPDEFCCLFVIDETFTNFLFIPYPED